LEREQARVGVGRRPGADAWISSFSTLSWLPSEAPAFVTMR
jgi:hypothetical protein